MTPHVILESGIRTWDESEPPDYRFATVSLVVSTAADLLPILNIVFPAVGGRFVSWFLWVTLGEVFEGNALQRRKLVATLTSEFGAFKNPVARVNDRIISKVASMSVPIGIQDLGVITDYRRNMLIGTTDGTVSAEALSLLMAPNVESRDPRALAALLAARDDLMFGRCYEDIDTHAAFQWFGHQSDLRRLESALMDLGVKLLKSRRQVAYLLSR